MNSSNPYLSIIIPVHNEENRLPSALEQLSNFLNQQTYSSEILVVENGSSDKTLEKARAYCGLIPNLTVIHEEQRGKGLAVRNGMLAARGEYRFFCDVDFSMPVPEINRFFPPELNGIDIAIGSREAPGSVRYNEPAYRHIVGRIFNSLVRWMAVPGLQDTQCGFKCFHARVVEDIFPLQTLTGMSFDAEVLFIARMRGYKIVELPIPWYFNPDSRVRLFKDSFRMALDLLTIRMNARRNLYARKAS